MFGFVSHGSLKGSPILNLQSEIRNPKSLRPCRLALFRMVGECEV